MRSFSDLDRLIGRVPANVVMNLRSVDTGRGSEALFTHQLPALLTELANRARVQSITASSAIEGVVVPDPGRASRIMNHQAGTLRNRSEQELAGYTKALDYLFQDDWRPLNLGLVLHLHRLLWSESPVAGGQLKAADNLVDLISRYRSAQQQGRHHPVLLVGLFVLDLLIIHPFEDGNGRVARALTNALLIDAGYRVCRWVSLEQLIAESADRYYEALLKSTHDWHADRADPWPWLSYFVEILTGGYETFARNAAAERSGSTKQARVRDYVVNHAPPVFRLADVRAALPGVSDQTIRLVLDQLKRERLVAPDGTGRAAVWRKAPTT